VTICIQQHCPSIQHPTHRRAVLYTPSSPSEVHVTHNSDTKKTMLTWGAQNKVSKPQQRQQPMGGTTTTAEYSYPWLCSHKAGSWLAAVMQQWTEAQVATLNCCSDTLLPAAADGIAGCAAGPAATTAFVTAAKTAGLCVNCCSTGPDQPPVKKRWPKARNDVTTMLAGLPLTPLPQTPLRTADANRGGMGLALRKSCVITRGRHVPIQVEIISCSVLSALTHSACAAFRVQDSKG
jgi:hypothetical protein